MKPASQEARPLERSRASLVTSTCTLVANVALGAASSRICKRPQNLLMPYHQMTH